MKEYLLDTLKSGGDLTFKAIILRLTISGIIACFIYISYWLSHEGSVYSKKFNVSLAALTLVTAMVMIVIGNNIALSLGMVGALSIVRFRTAIKDSRDTVYIFWAVVVGICCGANDCLTAGIGSCFIFTVLLLLGRIKNENRVLIIIRGARINEEKIAAVIFGQYMKKAVLKVKNTTEDTVELIYEISRRNLNKAEDINISDEIYALGGIEYFNTVLQSDDING